MARWLITRPAAAAEALAARLAASGHEGIPAPVLQIRFESGARPDLAGCQAVLLTSANAARALAALTTARVLPVLAVGQATAEAARAAGFGAVTTAAGDVASLARLAVESLEPGAGPVFHAAGRDVAGNLAETLRKAGFEVRQEALYKAEAVASLPPSAQKALEGGRLAGVLFFSPRTAAVFGTLVRQAGLIATLADLYALCLSPAVAGRLRRADWGGIRIAASPDQTSLLQLLDPPGRGGPALPDLPGRASASRDSGTRNAQGSFIRTQQQESGQDGMDPRPDNPPESSDDQDKAAAAGTTPSTDPESDGDAEHGGSPAERIIALFGGIRPMASKLHVPVTTVQGWKKRGAIPEARHDDIRNAAAAHGIALSGDDLAAATPEVTEAEAAAEEPGGADTLGAAAATTRAEPSAPAGGAWATEDTGTVGEAEKRALGVTRSDEPPEEPEQVEGAEAADRLEQRPGEEAASETAGPGRRPEPFAAAAGSAGVAAAAPATRPGAGDGGRGADDRGAGGAGGGGHDGDGEHPEEPPHEVAHGASGVAWLALVLAIVGTAGAFTAPLWGPSVAPSIWGDPAEATGQQVATLEEQLTSLDQAVADLADGQQSLRQRLEGIESEGAAAADAGAGAVREVESGLTALEDSMAAISARMDEIEAAGAGAGQPGGADLNAIGNRIDTIESRLSELSEAGPLPSNVEARMSELAEALAALEDRLAEGAGAEGPGGTGLADRIAALEQALAEEGGQEMSLDATALAALSGQLDAINSRVSGLDTRMTEVVEERLGALREVLGTLEELQSALQAVNQRVATVEGSPMADAGMADTVSQLQSRLGDLSGTLASVRQRVDEVAQAAAERRAADLRGQALSLATAQLRQQVNAGIAFAVPLQAVLSLLEEDSGAYQALQPLEAHASEGIATREQLMARFPEIAAQAREAAELPPDADWFDQTVSAVTGLVSVSPVPGEGADADSVEGRLARAAYRVSTGNLEAAVDALNGLEGEAAEAVSGWLDQAEARLAADAALTTLEERAIRRLMEVEAAAAAAGPGPGAGQRAGDAGQASGGGGNGAGADDMSAAADEGTAPGPEETPASAEPQSSAESPSSPESPALPGPEATVGPEDDAGTGEAGQ